MQRLDYDWSAEVAGITAPVMLVFADADAIRPAHIAEFYAAVGGGLRDANWDGSARPVARLAVLPSHTHVACVTSWLARPPWDAEDHWAPSSGGRGSRMAVARRHTLDYGLLTSVAQ